MYSRFLHVGACLRTPFLLLDKYTTDIVQRYHILFSHSSADRHVGGFPLLEMEQVFMAPRCPLPICCHSCLGRSAWEKGSHFRQAGSLCLLPRGGLWPLRSFPFLAVVFKSLTSPIRCAIHSRGREASTRKRKASLHFYVWGGPNGERLWVWGEVEPHPGNALGLAAGNG